MKRRMFSRWFGTVLVLVGSQVVAAAVSGQELLTALRSPILLRGDAHTAFRDPLLIHERGEFRLFYSWVREEEDQLIYWYTAVSTSSDLRNWSAPRALTPKDQNLNYASPGNVVRVGDEYLLCVQTYPIVGFRRGDPLRYADARARLWLLRSRDLETWSRPELINVKGPGIGEAALGKMIDPFLLRDKDTPGKWWCFFKQNQRVHCSWSLDLAAWTPGPIDLAHGENPCVIVQGDEYVLFYAPNDNGIGVKRSRDLVTWREEAPPMTLGQSEWPWAGNRITAGYVEDLRHLPGVGRYVLVFHGGGPGRERSDANENANCHIGIAWSSDLRTWAWPGRDWTAAAARCTIDHPALDPWPYPQLKTPLP